MIYDVIVIGSGPAGSVAAARTAEAGMKTLLLEKKTLPRHKTCGGGMPMLIANMIPGLSQDAVAEATVRYMRHTWKFEQPCLAPMNSSECTLETSLWMVRRSVFDYELACRAVSSGAELKDNLSVRSIEEDESGVMVCAETDNNGSAFTARARYLVGADGANGISLRASGLNTNREIAIAMETEVPYDWSGGSVELRRDVIHLEYGAVPHGYAWIFPKSDHLNVGAGIFLPAHKNTHPDSNIRETCLNAMEGYLLSLGLKQGLKRSTIHAHPLPLWSGRHSVCSSGGRMLLAGDAAGLVNPIFGDGILHAVISGKMAAESLIDDDPASYNRKVDDHFGANFDAARKLARFFYQWTPLVYKYGITRPSSTQTAARLLCGEALFTDAAGKAMRRIRSAMKMQG
jgi:geranylgeranyl reductase family protein